MPEPVLSALVANWRARAFALRAMTPVAAHMLEIAATELEQALEGRRAA
jgi:hypothetical protein